MLSNLKSSAILFCLFTLFINCKKQSEDRPKTAEELKSELKKREANTPLYYLSLNDIYLQIDEKQIRNKTLFRKAKYENDGATIYGTINNKATLADFKDISINVKFLSKTKSIISDNNYTIYEFFPSNSSKTISIKVYPPQESENFDLSIIHALNN